MLNSFCKSEINENLVSVLNLPKLLSSQKTVNIVRYEKVTISIIKQTTLKNYDAMYIFFIFAQPNAPETTVYPTLLKLASFSQDQC